MPNKVKIESQSVFDGLVWKKEGDGWFSAESRMSEIGTADFVRFARSSRARFDLVEFIKVKIQQFQKRK